MKQKLTPWFSIDVKPKRLGVYQYEDSGHLVYRMWFGDGFGQLSFTADRAAQATRVTWGWRERSLAGYRWRGLAADPNAQSTHAGEKE